MPLGRAEARVRISVQITRENTRLSENAKIRMARALARQVGLPSEFERNPTEPKIEFKLP